MKHHLCKKLHIIVPQYCFTIILAFDKYIFSKVQVCFFFVSKICSGLNEHYESMCKQTHVLTYMVTWAYYEHYDTKQIGRHLFMKITVMYFYARHFGFLRHCLLSSILRHVQLQDVSLCLRLCYNQFYFPLFLLLRHVSIAKICYIKKLRHHFYSELPI